MLELMLELGLGLEKCWIPVDQTPIRFGELFSKMLDPNVTVGVGVGVGLLREMLDSSGPDSNKV